MARLNRILTIYFALIAIGFIGFTTYHNMLDENKEFTGDLVVGINQEKIVELDKKVIFNAIADIKNYPVVLPKNIIDVNIINQTQSPVGANVYYVKEKITEAGVISTMIVKHSILPYSLHTIEIVDGDAKGTEIRIKFEQMEEKTKISVESTIKLHGILAPFGLLTRNNMESALDTSLNSFIEYAKNNQITE